MAELTRAPKVVFSSTLEAPLSWANTRLVSGDAVEAVSAMKRDGTSMSTLGSLTLCRSLLEAGLVDRFRVVVFPVITGSTGRERIYDGYPDVALDMVASRTFDGQNPIARVRPHGANRPAQLAPQFGTGHDTWTDLPVGRQSPVRPSCTCFETLCHGC